MNSLSLLGRNGGGQQRGNFQGFEIGSCSNATKELSASDLLRSSSRGFYKYWSKVSIGTRKRYQFCVFAKVNKGRKHEYPWPDNLDPNIPSEQQLTYLSHFKPLAEKPKPVTLPFEKPLMDLEQKIVEVQRMADETGLDFSDQIGALENKYQQALKDLYKHLTPIQRLAIARHPNRPTVLDHILNITDKWVELHGDRAGYNDPAIVTGLGTIDGKSYMFIGHQKGRNTKENIARNFAMPTPHGYRKALRLMKYADHHGFPIITFVDTPGAFADLKSEELGQGEAIARNLRTMFGFKVPIITVVTGEGGSGGALAIACANKLFMLENSAFYVASPEACAAILWKTSQAAPTAAEKLRITAQEHYRLKIADGIIPEPLGGAHADPVWTSQQIKFTIIQAMQELTAMDTEELLRHRRNKFRQIGGFQEGIPVEPERKSSMKRADVNTLATDLESEIENLKKKILEKTGPPDLLTSQAIEKLRQEVDKEMTEAFIAMGLQGKLELVKLELSKLPDTPNQPLNRGLQERVENLVREFNSKLSRPGAYLGLKTKLEKLNMVNRLVELKEKRDRLKAEINEKIPAEVKAKMQLLKDAQEKLREGDELDEHLVDEAKRAKEELEAALKSANLEIVGTTNRNSIHVAAELQHGMEKMKEEIDRDIARAVNAAGVGPEIEQLKAEVAKGSSPEHVRKMAAEIKEKILAALDTEALKEKAENLQRSARENGRC
ncbi:hypothetical protein EUGRSUZ_D02269 [Eucalyptus grandis]|uniref:Uncharacterized protein n=2 Tax=Eucalyptus grandis TaxID=71139 RepID=A0ACC3L7L2_EUCGR|nr:hypothetical protein EUGRSUZ_D02269 [Eucalyptus grandis]